MPNCSTRPDNFSIPESKEHLSPRAHDATFGIPENGKIFFLQKFVCLQPFEIQALECRLKLRPIRNNDKGLGNVVGMQGSLLVR